MVRGCRLAHFRFGHNLFAASHWETHIIALFTYLLTDNESIVFFFDVFVLFSLRKNKIFFLSFVKVHQIMLQKYDGIKKIVPLSCAESLETNQKVLDLLHM